MTSSVNRTAVLAGTRSISIENRGRPAPAAGEVEVAIEAVGVCGSDTHYFEHGRVGRFVVQEPLVLGHEASGRVVRCGDDVSSVTVGERVAIEPGVGCGACERCRRGQYNLCPDMRFLATPPIDGAFTQHLLLAEAAVFPMPETLSFEDGALLEPLSVGIWACRRAKLTPGERVLVTGAGAVGLLAAEVARASGAADVVVADRNPRRLDVAASRGFVTIDVTTVRLPALSIEVDVCLECSGASGVLGEAVRVLRPGGRVVMVGLPQGEELTLPLQAVFDREVAVLTHFRYANTWPTAIGLVASGRINLSGLVTHEFPLHRAADALMAGQRDPSVIKAAVYPQR